MANPPMTPSPLALRFLADKEKTDAQFRERYLSMPVLDRLHVLQALSKDDGRTGTRGREHREHVFYLDTAGEPVLRVPASSMLLLDRADAIREAKESEGMTQQQIAAHCGVTGGALSRVLTRAHTERARLYEERREARREQREAASDGTPAA